MTSLDGGPLAGVVFDKDGTLLDFHLTWDMAMGSTLSRLAPSAAVLEGAARAIGYDLARQRVEPSSQLIAESNATIMALLEPWLDTSTFQRVLDEEGAGRARPAAAADALLDMLGAASVVLGLVTNDSEDVAGSWPIWAGSHGSRRWSATTADTARSPTPGPYKPLSSRWACPERLPRWSGTRTTIS